MPEILYENRHRTTPVLLPDDRRTQLLRFARPLQDRGADDQMTLRKIQEGR